MSNSNRTPSRSPGPQIARYLHRIQQIVGTRNRTPSPISSRISRPLKPNSLDHYLKYQLTLKIICGFFDKSNKACMRHFFNCFRNIAISKIEKIYRFVPIEKTECSHMVVDSGISTKMLINIIKIKLKDHLRLGFDSIRSISTVQLTPRNSYTARSNMSVIFPLTISDKKKSVITIVLQNIYIKRMCSSFYGIKVECCEKQGIKQKKKQEFFLLEAQLKLFNTIIQKVKSKNINQAFTFILLYRRQSQQKPQIQIQNKYQQLVFFSNILLTKSIIKSFASLKESIYFIYHQKNNEKIFHLLNIKKELEAQSISQKKALALANEQIQAQSLALEDAQAAILENSRARNENDYFGSIYHATSKITTALISWLIRTKMEVIRTLEAIKDKKYQACILIRNVLFLKIMNAQSSSFQKILQEAVSAKILASTKSTSPSIREQLPLVINWKAISCLVKLDKYFTYALSPSFQAIKAYAEQQNYHQDKFLKIEQMIIKISLRNCFDCIKRYSIQQNTIRIELQKIQESSEQSLKNKEFLVKVLFKMATFSITSAFIKLKFNQKHLKAAASKNQSGWIKDVQIFLQERERFTRNSIQKFKEIETMIDQ